jgi:hypothetical protein
LPVLAQQGHAYSTNNFLIRVEIFNQFFHIFIC